MSLFFEKVSREVKRPNKLQRSAESLHKLGCPACPLNKAKVQSPKMPPTLADDTWIYFIGEAPGKIEDEKGKPFVGPSGQIVRKCITIPIDHCSFDNVCRDRPSAKNDDPPWAAIQCCRGYVEKDIENTKPKLIVGLGKFAQQWALGSADTNGMRGRIFAIKIGSHSCYFMPTYHPARVIHSAVDQAKRQSKDPKSLTHQNMIESVSGRTFKLDIEKACKFVRTCTPPVVPTEDEVRSQILTFTGNDKFNELVDLLKKAKKAPVKAIDIETTHLRPYANNAKILSCAISFSTTNISFALDHSKAGWSPFQFGVIKDLLRQIIADDSVKIAHNAPFECEWFAFYFGKESINHCAWECTQLQAYILDERRGARQSNNDEENQSNPYQALNFLVKMHFGVSFKDWFKVNRKNMVSSDLAEMLVYGGADTFFTLRLWGSQAKQLRASGLYNTYLGALPRQPTVALMQYLGLPVNQAKVKELQGKLAEPIAVIQAEIEALPVVQQYIKDKAKTDRNFEFNPLGHDVLNIFKDYLKCPEIHVEDGDKVRISIDKHVLDKIDHPLAKLIVALRNKTKMKSTYVDGLELGKGDIIWPDGRLHTNFNTTFTTTARLSSTAPNCQNYPKRADNWIREPIKAPDGYIMVAADFGQLEMCGAAMLSRDKVLVKYLWEDYDTHMFWAGRLAALCPERVGGDFSDPKIAKTLRSIVKNQLVFPAIYGSTNKSMAEGLGVDVEIVDELMKEFWGTFKGIKKWQKDILQFYRENGYVEDPLGFRRRHPLTSNEAINAPIQTVSSNIVVDAMCRLSYIASTEGKWYLHPHINIHDDLSSFVPIKKVDEAIERIVREMLTPNFDFINVPLSVEVSAGPNWANLEHVGKFWSHKDL
jgi:uracil-DNA glycosylase family 4